MTKSYYFEYDARNQIIATRFSSTLTDEILAEFYREAPRFLESRVIRAAIVDFTHVTSFDASSKIMRDLAAMDPLLPDPIPRFVIAPPDHVFGMVRMFQLLSHPKREALRVVRSETEAYAAFGIEEPQFERVS
jgi:hypothetical protein